MVVSQEYYLNVRDIVKMFYKASTTMKLWSEKYKIVPWQ